MVDSNDGTRLKVRWLCAFVLISSQEARDELWKILESDELKDAVILVLANKQDLPNAQYVFPPS